MSEDVFSIETDYLNFRPLRLGDESYIFPEVDEELTRYWIGWEPSKDIREEREKVKARIAIAEIPPNFEFVVFDKGGRFVGCCGVSPSEEPGEFEVDLWVIHSAQGKGYGKEMLQTALRWTKEHSNLLYVVYSYTEGNEASAAIIHRMNALMFREVTYLKRGELKRVFDHKIIL
ncbi:MAG: GNAT family N-acetyltransferase [Candidatus Moraniibacteriota bacterium]